MKNLNGLLAVLAIFFYANNSHGASIKLGDIPEPIAHENGNAPMFETSEPELIHDAYLEWGNGHNSTILRLEEGVRTSYLKFDLSGISGTVSQVQLQLTVSGDSDTGNGTVTVYEGSDSGWTESTLSSSNSPSSGLPLGSQNSGGSGTHTYNLSVSNPQIYSGILTLVLSHQGSDDLSYASDEHATTSIRPKLIVTHTSSGTSNCADTISNESNSVVIKRQEPGSWGNDNSAWTVAGVSNNTNGSPCALKVQKDVAGYPYAGYKVIINLGENNIAVGDTISIGLDGNGVSGNARLKVVSGTSNSVLLINHAYGEGQGWSSHTEDVVIPSGSSQLVLWLYPNIGSADVGYSLFDNLSISKVNSGGGDISVASVSLNTTNVSLEIGASQQLQSTISPSDATDKTVSWSSSNSTVATVNSNGLVSAIDTGTAVITVTTNDGSKTANSNFTVNESSNPPTGGNADQIVDTNIFYDSENVGIGTDPQSAYRLAVDGKIHTKEVKVDIIGWADYVFFNDYKLPTLKEVQKHIEEKGHLINIPSAKEVQDNGFDLGEMNKLLLEKIEELTLYILQQDKTQKMLEVRIESLEKK